MKRVLLGLAALLATVAAIVIVRTLMFTPDERATGEPVGYTVDGDRIAQHLSEAIRFRTISRQVPDPADAAAFDAFIAWMAATYPEVHAAMDLTFINRHTMLFRWEGSDSTRAPGLLTAHHDVVPIVPGTEDAWEHPPFSGTIADGFVWGRGALDDKGAVIALMEAATLLIRDGFTPAQTLYFSFGHDEEIGGPNGAAAVAAYLEAQGIQLGWSLDEGSFVLDGIVPGVDAPVAMINVAEKGYVSLDLTAHAEGGHSSMPARDTAVTILAEALVRLRDAPVPGGLDGLTGEAYGTLARHMPFVQRMAFANQWLFGGMVEETISAVPSGNAMLRTTTAPTMLAGSPKENVLPITATATVNFRLHPRDTVEGVVAHVREAIDDARIEVTVRGGREASPVAGTDTAAYRAVSAAARGVFGSDVIVAPGLTVGGTDSKHYVKVSDNAYRFHPFVVDGSDLPRLHGTNERISIDNLAKATAFYMAFLRAMDADAGP